MPQLFDKSYLKYDKGLLKRVQEAASCVRINVLGFILGKIWKRDGSKDEVRLTSYNKITVDYIARVGSFSPISPADFQKSMAEEFEARLKESAAPIELLNKIHAVYTDVFRNLVFLDETGKILQKQKRNCPYTEELIFREDLSHSIDLVALGQFLTSDLAIKENVSELEESARKYFK